VVKDSRTAHGNYGSDSGEAWRHALIYYDAQAELNLGYKVARNAAARELSPVSSREHAVEDGSCVLDPFRRAIGSAKLKLSFPEVTKSLPAKATIHSGPALTRSKSGL
jgi:hypothetical protein